MMQKFNSAGVEIAFSDEGQGAPVLLIHGFASNGRVNWQATGWTKVLLEAGYRVIAIDNRGHGESEKLYDAEQISWPPWNSPSPQPARCPDVATSAPHHQP